MVMIMVNVNLYSAL